MKYIMDTNKWESYNRCFISKSPPHIDINLNEMFIGFKASNCILAKWITEFDRNSESEWWFIIKDDVIDLNILKSKYRSQIKNALKLSTARIIDRSDYYDTLSELFIKVMNKRPQHKHSDLFNMFDSRFYSNNEKIDWWGVFLEENQKLVAFAIIEQHDDNVNLKEFFFDYDFLKFRISDALVYNLCFYYINTLNKKYISDGERSINHPTNIQDYLIKTFGFRKAYCKLNIKYKNKLIYYAARTLYYILPLLELIKTSHPMLGSFYSFAKLESIRYHNHDKDSR